LNAIILLLFAADPTGLQAAFESADSMDMSFMRTCFTVTLVNPETIRKMAALVEVEGDARKISGSFSTEEIILVTLHSGQKTTDFFLLGNEEIVFGGKLIKSSDKLWIALRAYFEPPDVVFEPRPKNAIPGQPPPREPLPPVTAAKTLQTAFESPRLDLKNITTGQSCTLKGAAIKLLAGLMRFKGDVSYSKRPDAKYFVEAVLENDETRTRFFVLGDILVWGSREKLYKQIKLEDDKLYLAMRARIESEPAVKRHDDSTGFQAAVEAADSLELTHRETGKTATIKGASLKEIALLPAFGRGGGAMAPGNKFLEGKEVIDIVVRKGEDTTDFKLVRDKEDIYMVFGRTQGPRNLLGKMSNLGLWQEIRGQFPMESAFPAKPEYAPKKVVPKEELEPDPTGLKAAIRGADTMQVTFPTGDVRTTSGGDLVAKLYAPVLIKGEIGPVGEKDAAAEVIYIVLTKGKKSSKYSLIRGADADTLVFGEKQDLQATLANHDLWTQLSPAN
jgi:hypothetical protein